MLRDDAIRAGLMRPTQEDIQRMSLAIEDLPKRPRKVFDTAESGQGIEAEIDLTDLTQRELMRKAKEMGIELPPHFIKKSELIELIKARF